MKVRKECRKGKEHSGSQDEPESCVNKVVKVEYVGMKCFEPKAQVPLAQ